MDVCQLLLCVKVDHVDAQTAVEPEFDYEAAEEAGDEEALNAWVERTLDRLEAVAKELGAEYTYSGADDGCFFIEADSDTVILNEKNIAAINELAKAVGKRFPSLTPVPCCYICGD